MFNIIKLYFIIIFHLVKYIDYTMHVHLLLYFGYSDEYFQLLLCVVLLSLSVNYFKDLVPILIILFHVL